MSRPFSRVISDDDAAVDDAGDAAERDQRAGRRAQAHAVERRRRRSARDRSSARAPAPADRCSGRGATSTPSKVGAQLRGDGVGGQPDAAGGDAGRSRRAAPASRRPARRTDRRGRAHAERLRDTRSACRRSSASSSPKSLTSIGSGLPSRSPSMSCSTWMSSMRTPGTTAATCLRTRSMTSSMPSRPLGLEPHDVVAARGVGGGGRAELGAEAAREGLDRLVVRRAGRRCARVRRSASASEVPTGVKKSSTKAPSSISGMKPLSRRVAPRTPSDGDDAGDRDDERGGARARGARAAT